MTQIKQNQQRHLKLEWKKISLIEKHSKKSILQNLSGQLQSRDFLTIMGSSGAGKSSFLSLITKTLQSEQSKFFSKGRVTLNGKQYDQTQFFSACSYVPQNDLLLQSLTVEQTFDFHAQLKLYNRSEKQRKDKVHKIIKLLNLYEIRNSLIGGHNKKSISGGQKKRVVIGSQLISDPLCLILDEPTSGLDSTSSLKIIKMLAYLAKEQNKLIITTIHQPSTFMFKRFDKLMVMKDGRQIFFDQASNLVAYMESLKISMDNRMNPVDFLMLEISAYKQQYQGYKTPMSYQNFQHYKYRQTQKTNNCIIEENNSALNFNFDKKQAAPLLSQLKPLLTRNIKNFIRSPSNHGGRLMQLLGFPLILGVLYFDILQRGLDLRSDESVKLFLSEFVSFLFIGMLFTVSQTVYDTVLVFPAQKQLVLKETRSNLYFISIYYCSKLIIEIPLMLFSVIVSNSIVYSIVGLPNDYEHWLLFVCVVSIIGCAGYFLGIITGTLCKNYHIAIQAIPLLMMPIVTYGGQIVNLSELPWYSGWIQYISPLSYGYKILVKHQLQTSQLFNLGADFKILKQLGLETGIRQNLTQLLLLTYSFVILSFFLLYMRKKLK